MINKWEFKNKQTSGYFPDTAVVFSELSTEEEEGDEDGSSDEFTDSIEEDSDQVTARSSASVAVRDVPPGSDVKELEAEKTLEGKLEETALETESGGYTSTVQMRYRFISGATCFSSYMCLIHLFYS